MGKVYGYARVSSVEQAEGTSLADQERRIRAYAASLKRPVARVFVEAESSIGRNAEQRAQMNALLAAVRPGDLVLCDRIDRWSRDPEFTYRSVREIAEKGAGFFAVEERIDPSTSEGDTQLNFRVLFAREEAKRIRARLVGTRQGLRSQGYWTEGPAPYGYKRQAPAPGDRRTKNVLVIDEPKASHVREVFRLCVLGRSIKEIVRATGVTRDIVANVLRQRAYTGEIETTDGQWIAGKHPAIVPKSTFVAAQKGKDARTKKGRAPKPDGSSETSDWLLRDVARCGLCGFKMGAAYAGPHGDGRRYYYRCVRRCTSRFVPVKSTNEPAWTEIALRMNAIRAELSATSSPKKTPINLADQKAKLESKRDRYLEMYAEGTMSKATMLARVARVDADLLELAAEKEEAPQWDERARKKVIATFPGLLAGVFASLVSDDKRRVVSLLVESVRLAHGKAPEFAWQPMDPARLGELSQIVSAHAPSKEWLERAKWWPKVAKKSA